MFDSLNRHMLPPYGCDWVHAPNFARLAEKTVVFQNSYVGSMPCMPARREIHTGRYNFLHRSWGPIEPFDDSMPEILSNNGIHTHLATDHQHYWEDGGATYHNRYSTYEFFRGQEGDRAIGQVAYEPPLPNAVGRCAGDRQTEVNDRINRKFTLREDDFPGVQTLKSGLEFIELNKDQDNWFLHCETFEPHEPYFVPERFKAMYPDFDFSKIVNDWPEYKPVTDEDRYMVEHMRHLNAALISMCDHYLGKILDAMDKYDLWKDTMLMVNTDHGFLLGEHDWWAKCVMPFYNEVARTPFFLYDPRNGIQGEQRETLVQNIDWAPTLLEYFNQPIPKDMKGLPIGPLTVKDQLNRREAIIFGLHGAHVNITDGQYVYMRGPQGTENKPLFNYTLMPTHMRRHFSIDELQHTQLAEPFEFTKNLKTLKVKVDDPRAGITLSKVRNDSDHNFKTMLFDLHEDPKQENPINNPEQEERLCRLMVQIMKENDAPEEQYQRLGLTQYL